MIGKLRIKFICITMTLITALLAVLLAAQYTYTCSRLERASLTAMEAVGRAPADIPRPGLGSREQPCFVLTLMPGGDLRASGSDYYDLTDAEALMTIYRTAAAGGRSSGVLDDWELRYCRVEIHGERRYVFTDISGELQTLRELRRNSVLVGSLGFFSFLILSTALANWAISPVEQAWEQQRQFVADASHELKTPLTVILTNAELLTEPACSPQQRQQFTDSILTMSRQMRTLVERMLQLARADSGQNTAARQRLDYSRLVEEAVLPFEPVYFEAGRMLESRVEPGLCVMGNASELRQVAEILLDNGRKYSAPGSTVRLALTRQCHQCCLTVSSPGTTLDARQCRDIFKRFYRADPVRSSGSYGLGLAIAQRIVTGHRGKIWAEGRDGINTFFVTLPLQEPGRKTTN